MNTAQVAPSRGQDLPHRHMGSPAPLPPSLCPALTVACWLGVSGPKGVHATSWPARRPPSTQTGLLCLSVLCRAPQEPGRGKGRPAATLSTSVSHLWPRTQLPESQGLRTALLGAPGRSDATPAPSRTFSSGPQNPTTQTPQKSKENALPASVEPNRHPTPSLQGQRRARKGHSRSPGPLEYETDR